MNLRYLVPSLYKIPILFILFCNCSSANAADASLAWDPSVSPNIAGYKVYVGKSSRTYDTPITIGNRTTCTVAELSSGIYYFAVTAFDVDGNESDFSNEVSQFIGTTLALPRFAALSDVGQQRSQSSENDMMGLALTNLGSEPAFLNFTAMDSSGNVMAGPGIINPRPWVLSPKSQIAVLDTQIFGEGFANSNTQGWIKLESANPNVGGFFLDFGAGNSYMDGANFGITPLSHFIFTEIEPAGSTRINIANGNPAGSIITFNLLKADGTVRATQSRWISGNGALVADLFADIFYGIEPIPNDYVRISSELGLEPFELMQKGAGDISCLTGQDVTAGGTTLYSPQYVLGAPWRMRLSVVNLEFGSGMVTFRFVGENGVQIGSTRTMAIPPLGKLLIDTPSFFTSLNPGAVVAGYIEIQSDGVRLAGSTVFEEGSGQSFSSALPLIYNLQNSVVFSQVVSNDQYYTGIAILNPNATDANVVVELYSADGKLMDSVTKLVPAKQRRAMLLTEYFPSLLGKNQTSGYIRLISEIPIASFALFGTNDLSVLSAIPPQVIR